MENGGPLISPQWDTAASAHKYTPTARLHMGEVGEQRAI